MPKATARLIHDAAYNQSYILLNAKVRVPLPRNAAADDPLVQDAAEIALEQLRDLIAETEGVEVQCG